MYFFVFYGYCPYPEPPTHPNMDKSIFFFNPSLKRNPRKYKNFYNIRRLDRDLQKFFSKNNLSQKCLNMTEVGLWINIFFTSSKEVDIFLKASRRQIHVDIDLWGSRWRTLISTHDKRQINHQNLKIVFGTFYLQTQDK